MFKGKDTSEGEPAPKGEKDGFAKDLDGNDWVVLIAADYDEWLLICLLNKIVFSHTI